MWIILLKRKIYGSKKTASAIDMMGERLQQLRKNTGLTQTELVKKIGISHTQMARYYFLDDPY